MDYNVPILWVIELFDQTELVELLSQPGKKLGFWDLVNEFSFFDYLFVLGTPAVGIFIFGLLRLVE